MQPFSVNEFFLVYGVCRTCILSLKLSIFSFPIVLRFNVSGIGEMSLQFLKSLWVPLCG